MLRKRSKLQRKARLNVGTKSGSWKTSISEPGPDFVAAVLTSTSQNFLGFGRRKGGRKDCHQAVNSHRTIVRNSEAGLFLGLYQFVPRT